MSGSSPSVDTRQRLTDAIIAEIEKGAADWKMPWHRPGATFALPRNIETDKAYSGINILSLWIAGDRAGYAHALWGTYLQWQRIGAQVRKGERGSLVVKYGTYERKGGEAVDSGDDTEVAKYLKHYFVFNAAQVENFTPPPVAPVAELTVRLVDVGAFIAATGAEFREGGTMAFYRRRGPDGSGDYILMPPRSLFVGTATSTPTESYEATRLHELGHFTGADHLLAGKFGDRFGDKANAFEELVAELHAAYACAHLGITNAPRPDHAQYLSYWLDLWRAAHKGNNREVSVM